MNEEGWHKYYARLGIEPPSAAAPVVKDADLDSAVPEGTQEKVLVPSEVEEVKVVESANGPEDAVVGDLRESAADETAPEPNPFRRRKTAEEFQPERATLAVATILPLSLVGTKKVWVWIAVLACVAIAVYLLLKWYSGKSKIASPLKEESQTVEGFMQNI